MCPSENDSAFWHFSLQRVWWFFSVKQLFYKLGKMQALWKLNDKSVPQSRARLLASNMCFDTGSTGSLKPRFFRLIVHYHHKVTCPSGCCWVASWMWLWCFRYWNKCWRPPFPCLLVISKWKVRAKRIVNNIIHMFFHEEKKRLRKKLLDLSCDQSLYGKD